MSAISDNPSDTDPASVVLLLGGVHVDRTGRLNAQSVLDSSNPGRFQDGLGGACLNVAGVLSALGQRPRVRTVLGDDASANEIRSVVSSWGIDLAAQTIKNHPTGTYTSIIESDGSLLIALADMEIYDLFEANVWSKEIMQLNKNDWLCIDANLPTGEMAEAIDLCSAQTVGFTVSKAKAPKLRDLAPKIDLLFTNVVEVGALCRDDTKSDADDLAFALSNLGIRNAVVSSGPHNVTVFENGVEHHIPVPTAKSVVDVTGAGDALAGGTIFALTDGAKLRDAVEFGIRAAQKTLETEGPRRADLAFQLGLTS